MLTEEQLTRAAKLPVWAHDLILGLNRKIQQQAEQIERLIEGAPADSNAVVNPHSDLPTPLDRNPTVRFRLDDGGCLETRFDGTTLTVSGNGQSPWDDFVIRPKVSNSVGINFAPEQPRR